jgi:hypothetical protein
MKKISVKHNKMLKSSFYIVDTFIDIIVMISKK